MAIADPPTVTSVRDGSRGMRRALAIFGALVLALLIAYGAFVLIDVASRHSFEVRASYGAVRSLQVDGGTGDVLLIGAPAGSDVGIIEHITEGLSAPHRHDVRGAGGALHLSSTCSTAFDNNCGVSYTIAVPPGVTVDASSGDGDVNARNLSVTGPLKLTSGNGDVSALSISAGNVTLKSGNGDVTATLVYPATRLEADSGNGDVNLTVPNTTYAVQASSGNGTVSDQTLRIDPSAPRAIIASSGNGDVTVTAAGAH